MSIETDKTRTCSNGPLKGELSWSLRMGISSLPSRLLLYCFVSRKETRVDSGITVLLSDITRVRVRFPVSYRRLILMSSFLFDPSSHYGWVSPILGVRCLLSFSVRLSSLVHRLTQGLRVPNNLVPFRSSSVFGSVSTSLFLVQFLVVVQ